MIRYFFIAATALIISCKNPQPKNVIVESSQDTIIGCKHLTEEIAGSAFQKKATSYFVIINNDTIDFMPIFSESKRDGSVGVSIRFENTLTYKSHLNYLKLILPKAAQDYNFDSLNSVYIGRLYASGDLAIRISNQYLMTFEKFDNIRTTDYKRIQDFLLNSQLANDFNELFSPYSLTTEKISIEKAFFTTKEEVFKNCKIETDSSKIPEKILDCMTGIQLRKKQV